MNMVIFIARKLAELVDWPQNALIHVFFLLLLDLIFVDLYAVSH